MKKLLFMILLGPALFAQQQVYNVQKYCIDEQPLKSGQCDVSGNEYSFVFVDRTKNEVTLFLSTSKFKYRIVDVNRQPNASVYNLKSESENATMTVHSGKTRIEFVQPQRHIMLTVGKSTKS